MTKTDYRATQSFIDKRTGDRVYFEMEIDTYALLEHMAIRALESKTGVATGKAGSIRVRITGRKKR